MSGVKSNLSLWSERPLIKLLSASIHLSIHLASFIAKLTANIPAVSFVISAWKVAFFSSCETIRSLGDSRYTPELLLILLFYMPIVTKEAEINLSSYEIEFPLCILSIVDACRRGRDLFSLALYATPYQCYHGNGGDCGGDSILIDAGVTVTNCWLCPSREKRGQSENLRGV